MVHLRLIVPVEVVSAIVDRLRRTPGVAHVVHLDVVSASPPGQLVLCDVAREAANDVIEWLQDADLHRSGAIVVDSVSAVISDSAATAEADAPGLGTDAVVWEEIESAARNDGTLSASFLVFMAVASVIAGVGILLDAPILIVGAMVVGPEYAPLSALCVHAVRRRSAPSATALATLGVGLVAAGLASWLATLAFRVAGLGPTTYRLGDRELTAFISQPDGMAAVVAVLAGVVGMLSLTESRSGALVGVLVSVTTIPAVANVGVATAYGEWPEVRGSAVQLGVNLAGLVVAGVATLWVQSRITTGRRRTTGAPE